jgi:cytochrome c-type biogenesis protein CcmE
MDMTDVSPGGPSGADRADGTDAAVPAGGLDLTPRPAPETGSPAAVRARSRRRWGPILVLVLVVVGVGFVAAQALNTATTFFYNADEAVANQSHLGTSRFRLQGTVEPGSIERNGTGVAFKVTFNGTEVAVVHQGDPPQLFKDAMPVVLEGHWDQTGERFDSDRMLVKHDANYVAKNGDRLKQADDGGTVPPSSTVPTPPSTAAPAPAGNSPAGAAAAP